MDTIISRRLSSDRLYAYHRNRFWLWDDTRHSWKESHLMSQKFEREHAARPTLTPADFMTDLTKFQQLDSYEIDSAMLDALKDARPCKTAPVEPVEEERPTPSAQYSDAATVAESQTVASPAAPEGSSLTMETADVANGADAQGNAAGESAARSAGSGSFLSNPAAPTFDYAGLDTQTVDVLHMAESQYSKGKKMAETGLRWMVNAVSMAHDALCSTVVQQLDNGSEAGVVPQWDNSKHGNRGEDSFRAWCASIGVSKSSAYRLLSVSEKFGNIEVDGKSILDVQPATLLYEAAKPSAPADMVQKVTTCEITSSAEYRAVLKENQQLRTDRVNAINQAEREKQRADAAEAREEEAWKLQSKSEAKAKDAETELEAVTADLNGLYDRAAQAEARNTALLDERAEYVQRIKELESRPIEVMHDPEETDRLAHQYAYGIAADMTEELRTKNNQQSQTIAALQKELEAARSTNGYDPQSDLETVCACIGSMEQMWGTALPAYERLSGKDLRTATDTLQDVIGRLYADMARTAEDGED